MDHIINEFIIKNKTIINLIFLSNFIIDKYENIIFFYYYLGIFM